MGKNTPERQEYIIRNLRFEHDIVNEQAKAQDGKSKDTEPVLTPDPKSDESEAA